MPNARTAYRLEDVYAKHVDFVRRKLASFGVAAADIDDLCHDVFLIVHARLADFEERSTIRLWLRQICWNVANSRRRRASHRLEVQTGDFSDTAPIDDEMPSGRLENVQETERLHAALAQLDAQRRDLFALRVIGGLTVAELAEVANCDPKTARKRLLAAERRLGALLSDSTPLQPWSAPAHTSEPVSAAPSPQVVSLGFDPEFRILATTPVLRVATLGSVILADWPGEPTLASLDVLDSCVRYAIRSKQIRFGYFTVIEPTSSFPSFEARQRMSSLLKIYSADCIAYATVIQGRLGRVATAIMTALGVLSRVPYPMHFFSSVQNAAAWMAKHMEGTLGAPDADEMIEAMAYLRVVETV